ncbi:LysR family transcriptional regulator [Bordetella bronchiseptica]|uniref:LysR substrate-binding domain-containing protein n=1 Tax=Bordetella bronchiseptica TaxID=518 RepID=UPI000461CC7C|nr:LysR family transcriptional regulator [Bordetella bronchiseptica]KDD14705.1 LysR substrate-binding domain protein [Bordetella bronchiseptica MBORD731]
MDRFDAMRAFARVVETGSFTKAADTLHMSKTNVTQLVQQLEARLRVRLLNRTTRKVNATADGAAYYERVRQLLADLEDAETSLSGASATPGGRLRVDVPSPFASTILVPALPAFQARYPDILLHLGVSDREVDLIDENVDCVIRGGQIGNLSLAARHVGDLQLGVYASPGYLARAGVPAHPHELQDAQHRIIGFSWSRARRLFPCAMRRADERIEVAGRHALLLDEGNAYLAAGLAAMGVIGVPTYMAEAHVERGALIRLFGDWRLDPMPLYIAYPQNRHVSAKLRVFIDWIVELMARHAPVTDAPPPRRSARMPGGPAAIPPDITGA